MLDGGEVLQMGVYDEKNENWTERKIIWAEIQFDYWKSDFPLNKIHLTLLHLNWLRSECKLGDRRQYDVVTWCKQRCLHFLSSSPATNNSNTSLNEWNWGVCWYHDWLCFGIDSLTHLQVANSQNQSCKWQSIHINLHPFV